MTTGRRTAAAGDIGGKNDREKVAFILAPILARRLTRMKAKMRATNIELLQQLKCVFYNKCLVSVCNDAASDCSSVLSVQHEAT